MATRKTKRRVGLAVMTLCIALLVSALAGHTVLRKNADFTPPSPSLQEQQYNDDGFPEVDWDYWLAVNPDIVGWMTVPGTSIDKPIVQARQDDPQRYLNYDVYGNWNYYGAVYLDAGCIGDGLESQNCVIFAHNMGGFDDSMFGELANFSDAAYAQAHSRTLIQTPAWKDVEYVRFVDVAGGWEATKRTDFEDGADYERWYLERFSKAALKLSEEAIVPSKSYTLVTCSYNYWDNERTLVYAF